MRNLAIVLVLVSASAMSFGVGEGEESFAGDYTLSAPGTYPVVEPMYEFDVVTIYSSVESSGKPRDSKFTTYLEDLTNVRVNFIDVIESGAAGEKINLMLASGDLPDVLMTPGHNINVQTTYQHGVTGTFHRLNNLIDNHMPALKRELEKWPQYYQAQLTMPDGGIYNLPELETGLKVWMYQPWFDKLELDFPPTTTDELYEVLKAFKEGDPNGNGIADEIPMLGATTGWNAQPLNFIMNAFTYTGRGTYGGYLQQTPDSLRFVANTPEWRDGLRYLRLLYDEGLIRETFTQKNIENLDIDLVGSFSAGSFGIMTGNGGGTGRFADFKPIAPLKGPAGDQYTYFTPQIRYRTFITAAEEHPEIVIQWANWFYEDPLVNSNLNEYVQDELADLAAGVTGLVDQWSAKFIVGNRDIEDQSQWDKYVSELDRVGVERYVQIWKNLLGNFGYIFPDTMSDPDTPADGVPDPPAALPISDSTTATEDDAFSGQNIGIDRLISMLADRSDDHSGVEIMLSNNVELLESQLEEFASRIPLDSATGSVPFGDSDGEAFVTLGEAVVEAGRAWIRLRTHVDAELDGSIIAQYDRYMAEILNRSNRAVDEKLSRDETRSFGDLVTSIVQAGLAARNEARVEHDLHLETVLGGRRVCNLDIYGVPRGYYLPDMDCKKECLLLRDSSPATGEHLTLGWWIMWAKDSDEVRVSENQKYNLLDPPTESITSRRLHLTQMGEGVWCDDN